MTEVQPTERVVEILQAACRVIARDGAHGLRMDAVAREAGVSKALVHYYFQRRLDLLRQAFAYSEGLVQARVDAELALLRSGAEKLERFLVLYVDDESVFAENRALWNEAWSSMRLDEEVRPEVEHVYRAWVTRVRSLVEEGLADGSIPKRVDPEAASIRLTAIADGLDSLLMLGIIEPDRARALVRASVDAELGR
jgi:AcrR family transcriptional regulator